MLIPVAASLPLAWRKCWQTALNTKRPNGGEEKNREVKMVANLKVNLLCFQELLAPVFVGLKALLMLKITVNQYFKGLKRQILVLTFSPSFTAMVLTTPALEDGISVDALSLSTVSRLWSTLMVSPTFTSSSITVTSSKSPISVLQFFA